MVFLRVGPEINQQDKVKIGATGWFYGSRWFFAHGKLLRSLERRSPSDLQETGCSGDGCLREELSWQLLDGRGWRTCDGGRDLKCQSQ